jgi:hypothetical protein
MMWHYTEPLDQTKLIHHQIEDVGPHQEYHLAGLVEDHQDKGQVEDHLVEDHQEEEDHPAAEDHQEEEDHPAAEDHQEDPHSPCHKHHNREDTMVTN